MARVYVTGEVYRVKARAHEPDARVFIVKIDRQENGEEILHTALDNVALGGADRADAITTIPHLPVSPACLEASVVEKIRYAGAMPDVSEGYALWHAAFEKGEAGTFDIPIAEILDVMEAALRENGG